LSKSTSSPKVNRGIQARASIPLAAQGEQVTATYLLTTLPTLASSYPTLVPVSSTRENVLGQNCCDEIYETRPTEIWFATSPPMDNSLLNIIRPFWPAWTTIGSKKRPNTVQTGIGNSPTCNICSLSVEAIILNYEQGVIDEFDHSQQHLPMATSF
jgi:hypothetical protein